MERHDLWSGDDLARIAAMEAEFRSTIVRGPFLFQGQDQEGNEQDKKSMLTSKPPIIAANIVALIALRATPVYITQRRGGEEVGNEQQIATYQQVVHLIENSEGAKIYV